MSNLNKEDILTYSISILFVRWAVHLRWEHSLLYFLWSFAAMLICGFGLAIVAFSILKFYEVIKLLTLRGLKL